MKTIYPQLRLTDPNFKYINAASTDIRETFRRIKSGQNKENNKPLVPQWGQSLEKPLVEPSLPVGGFVLSAEWFEILG